MPCFRITKFCYLGLLFTFLGASSLACTEKQKSKPKLIDDALLNIDLDQSGPYSVSVNDYSLEGTLDPKVFAELATDVRGRLYLPEGKGPFPFLVFLHGNHGTCGEVNATTGLRDDSSVAFAKTGSCPPGYVEAPTYAGYDYIGRDLASHGYAIISINANLGINGVSGKTLIKERGLLVLKHLAKFSEWNRGGAPATLGGLQLQRKFDFAHVGFMGHSRGGEGVRAAYTIYNEQRANSYASDIGPMKVEGIFELAPVDRYEDEIYNVKGTNWTVVIGSCDGDLVDYDGVDTFRRRRSENGIATFSSILVVPGGNHNHFNTEWHIPDTSCGMGERELSLEKQQEASRYLHNAFFRGFVGPKKVQNLQNVFDPQYRLPRQISNLTQLARESHEASKARIVPELSHSPIDTSVEELTMGERSLTKIQWGAKTASYTSLLNLSPSTIEGFDTLSFSISNKNDPTCALGTTCEDLNFKISLVYEDGSESDTVILKNYVAVPRLPAPEVPEVLSCKKGKIHDPEWCLLTEISNEESCVDTDKFMRLYFEDGCYEKPFSPYKRNLLFYEVPIELRDFKYRSGTKVKGLRFHFNELAAGSFFYDKKLVLRSKR